MKQNQKGFTLVELLVIIAIVAFLVAAVLLALQNSRAKARDAKRVSDAKQIANALSIFFANCESYPIEPTAITLGDTTKLFTGTASGCGDKTGSSAANGGWGETIGGTTILGQMEAAPVPPDGTCTDAQGSNRYTYSSDSTGSTYTLSFCIGRETGNYTTPGVQTIKP
jgi:prepilin-type N-terminal cleavage/methylation domain-containing protein